MGNKNNGAHTVRLAPYLLLCLVQAIPQLPLCGFFRLLIPLPLLLAFFLPSSTLFHAKQRGLVALAALHSSTSLRLQITCLSPPQLLSKFGEVEKQFFITAFSEQLTCWAAVHTSATEDMGLWCHVLSAKP